MKIRGTASHVAEKYMSLARDALASGDMVTAESYLQHAEHYNRIIMAAQAQAGPQGVPAGDQANGAGRQRQNPDGSDDEADGETAEAASNASQPPRSGGGRDRGRGRQAGNGAEGVGEANGAEPVEAQAAEEGEEAPGTVS